MEPATSAIGEPTCPPLCHRVTEPVAFVIGTEPVDPEATPPRTDEPELKMFSAMVVENWYAEP